MPENLAAAAAAPVLDGRPSRITGASRMPRCRRALGCCGLVVLLGVGGASATDRLMDGTTPILPFSEAEWLVSDWPVGQSPIAQWAADNVREDPASETVELVLDDSGPDERPFRGAEFQSRGVAETGTWRWVATAPDMVDGAVFGLFLYREYHDKDPWREYDIEFVGADTTEVQLNIHFEKDTGERVSLADARGGPVTVELGFDAAEGPHRYEIELEPRRAIFRIDGEVVGDFGPDDMPEGVWSAGPVRSFVDLWPVPPEQADWAGPWRYPSRPLVGRIHAFSLPEQAR